MKNSCESSPLNRCVLACQTPNANRVFWVFFGLNIIDILLAIYGIGSRQMPEMNPIIDRLVQEHWTLAIAFKVVVAGTVGLLALWRQEIVGVLQWASYLLMAVNLFTLYILITGWGLPE
ncbi:hypothetical protein H8D30_02580 [bacterium]|nr:hypothetical protein [bacterium]